MPPSSSLLINFFPTVDTIESVCVICCTNRQQQQQQQYQEILLPTTITTTTAAAAAAVLLLLLRHYTLVVLSRHRCSFMNPSHSRSVHKYNLLIVIINLIVLATWTRLHESSVEMTILGQFALIDPDLCTSCRISRSRLMDHSTTSWY